MNNINWDMLITKEMKELAIKEQKLREDSSRESLWSNKELLFIVDQLLALEDDDPTALPVTEREWRDYRIKVRAWKDGNSDFPDADKRPSRPIGD